MLRVIIQYLRGLQAHTGLLKYSAPVFVIKLRICRKSNIDFRAVSFLLAAERRQVATSKWIQSFRAYTAIIEKRHTVNIVHINIYLFIFTTSLKFLSLYFAIFMYLRPISHVCIVYSVN